MKNKKINRWIAAAIGLFLLSLSGCGGGAQTASSSASSSQVAENTIIIKNFDFSPKEMTIKKGTTLTWINKDGPTHNIVGDAFKSGDLKTGDTFEFTFNETGTFAYHCGLHPNMTGTIIVE
ncbi:cupredoxin [Trichococcus palustris]|uniref:Cupredoxin n=1 Tax=Trichococcus palustris TaxID=140314 RepID=A0A143Y465_9LACT|nr:cupredoxin family copper-binding protein [Trichococcus palustris]CZQ80353.1 cupredoxin [Trichococcus palustris]SFK64753.1 Plastocyanin [Trichococcus palustris]